MFHVHHLKSVLIFSILNHPRSFIVHSYLFGVCPHSKNFKVSVYIKAILCDAKNYSEYLDVAPLIGLNNCSLLFFLIYDFSFALD